MKANHFDLSDSGMEDNEFLLTNPPSRITFTDK